MSKRSLYLFNPDHDLALANADVNYMPPASARQMAVDLSLLPVWYAEAGSAVLAPSAGNQSFLHEMQAKFSLPVTLMTELEVSANQDIIALPWGWNPAVRKRLLLLGMPESLVPTPEKMEIFRRLSHRLQAVHLLPRLQLDASFCGESTLLTDAADWQRFVEQHDGCLLKAPLSGSGKGLNWCKGVFTPFISGWCAHVASSQGGVVGEPIYNKVEDFAMEFFSDGAGRVAFGGYSLFRTGSNGAYAGNLLLPDTEIERKLSRYVPSAALQAVRMRLEVELSTLLGGSYSGYLGVDMMICGFATSPEYRIHPCVEINLRMNMGVVSRLLYDRYVCPGNAESVFRIIRHSLPGEALEWHEQMLQQSPLQLRQGKILSGYLPLTPVTKHTGYCAYILGR